MMRPRDLDGSLDAKENWPELVALTSFFCVELPGIEPGALIAVSCGNAESDDAKQRQPTRNELWGVTA
jgi:hypothetical protein